MKKKKIIIIGAGLSGLYLATLLQKQYDVLILEARSRIGGRIYSLGGHDMGPSWVWPHQKKILTLIHELKLQLLPQFNEGLAMYERRDKVELFNPPPSTPSARIEGGMVRLIEKLYASLSEAQIVLDAQVVELREDVLLQVKTHENIYEADFVIATLPPRLACKNMVYHPSLSDDVQNKMQKMQTWMGNSAKCVVEFKSAFWRAKGLSGFVFSNTGPLVEVHDACIEGKAALFGFVGSHTLFEYFEEDVKKQMIRIFGIETEDILNVYFVDWKKEKFTATADDAKPLSVHPSYGLDVKHFNSKMFFSSTECSFIEGGYLEGALHSAENIVRNINNTRKKMKTFEEAMEFRHACKVFDESRKISDDELKFILEAGRKSPSSFGMEAWKFLVITNEALKAKLRPACWNQVQVTSCSHLVVILAGIDSVKVESGLPKKRFQRRDMPQEKLDFYLNLYAEHLKETLSSDENIYAWTSKQSYIAAANMMSAAAVLEIDSCPIEGFDKAAVEEILALDVTKYQLSMVLPFGYRIQEQPTQLRLDYDEVVEFVK